MRARSRTILRRRAVAVLAAVGATALLWELLADRPGGDAVPAEAVVTGEAGRTSERTSELSAEEKVSQLLLVAAEPGDPPRRPVGGVVVGIAGPPGPAPGRPELRRLREAAGDADLPALVAVRQEGGEYRTLSDRPPAARQVAVGDLADPAAAEAWARQAAERLAALGIDLNLAPVADIATLDSALADRAFSDDPEIVRRMTAAAVRGCRRGGIACAPSHFPGQGAASADTAVGPASVGLDAATLIGRDLVPFVAAFEAGAPAVVVSHAFFSAYDPVAPASATAPILQGLLRGQAGFEGVAITDDLSAGAIAAGSGERKAAVAAIAAGADMVQVGASAAVEPVRRALLEAVTEGGISPARLDEAVGRVVALKRKLGLAAEVDIRPHSEIGD